MELLFLLSAVLVFYTYVGYPLVLLLKHRIPVSKDSTYEPPVCLIIVAHNEDSVIVSKLENSLSLDYPRNKLHIVVASDGSTDRTVELASRMDGVTVLELKRMGKTHAQNEAVKTTNSEILVFSDANAEYNSDAIKKLAESFADPDVGCVCGELQYRRGKSGERFYWRYEVFLKQLESRAGILLGANGSIYAVRKDCFHPLPADTMSDFLEPILIYGTGRKVIYEPQAIAVEDEPRVTFSRKRRIILRALNSLPHMTSLMNPFRKHNLSVSILSHKAVRWFMPFLLATLFLSNVFLLEIPFYRIFFTIQLLFYAGALFSRTIRYFIVVNVASFAAIIDWLRGVKITTWKVER